MNNDHEDRVQLETLREDIQMVSSFLPTILLFIKILLIEFCKCYFFSAASNFGG